MTDQIIQDYKTAVFTRDTHLMNDKFVCMKCRKPLTPETAIAHRITDATNIPFSGFSVLNGITLCPDCTIKANRYHETRGSGVSLYYPFDLYTLISSSFEAAHADCMRQQQEYDEKDIQTTV